LEIRESTAADLQDVLRVEQEAFGEDKGPEIAELVHGLLDDPSALPRLSLLAFNEGQAVGHVLFTKAGITGPDILLSAAILAPLAVVPDAQSQDVGGQLIREGLRRLTVSGVALVFVLGHPGYYPRHGFNPAGALGFEAPYPIPEKDAAAWMVQELRDGVIGRYRGKVTCADTLNQPEHWRE
jgi:predicted N-acetyltransferase YhbS